MTTQIAKWGNSLAVRLPQAVAKQAKLAPGDAVELSVREGTVVVRRRRTAPTLRGLVAGVTDENRHTATDSGTPVGKEIW